jgi:uncharacterized membrane protein (DUF2068 family)
MSPTTPEQIGTSHVSPAVRKRGILAWIAIYKIAKATLTLAAGIATLHLRRRDLSEMAVHLVHRLNIAPDSHLASWLLAKVLQVNERQLEILGIGFFLYSILYFIEGIGLYLEKSWAEWLIVISSSLLLPLELYELFHRMGWMKVVLLLANIAVILYLIWRIGRERQDVHPKSRARSVITE